jgi:hypothetical protein
MTDKKWETKRPGARETSVSRLELAYVLMCSGKPIRCYASAARAQQGLDLSLEVGPPGPYYEVVAVLKVE